MDKVELVQKIGNEVCEGCNSDADCGIDPAECSRIENAVNLLDKYVVQLYSFGGLKWTATTQNKSS